MDPETSAAKVASQLDQRGTKILQLKNSEKCGQQLVPECVAIFFHCQKNQLGLADFGKPLKIQ